MAFCVMLLANSKGHVIKDSYYKERTNFKSRVRALGIIHIQYFAGRIG